MKPSNYPVSLELRITEWESLGSFIDFLRYVRSTAAGGHSFAIEADRADLGDSCPKVYVDGDGNDQIGAIILNGKDVSEGTGKSHARPGSRENPIVLRSPEDLDRARADLPQATPEQALADRYRMGHVIVGGLRVTIETPKGKYRFGRNPHGARWHVIMPADYGYLNDTKDADGDGVDVYLGPDSHRAAELPVWVVDQRHAHNRRFDEHKCMLGFPDSRTAHAAYVAGFSDGKGQERIGAVTRMDFGSFLTWLRFGDKKEPLAYRRRKSAALTSESAVDDAALRTGTPTDAQARAGNYRMGHVRLGDLDVSIENRKGSVRSGVGPDGVRWEVVMPAHYGYVKRTEGSDGDHVDVYLGDEAHRADELPVWIVDQRDADTSEFDEHKCMLGFPDSATAHRTYLAAFSDGRGQNRIGAVVRTTFDGFRRWLREGDTGRPLAYGTPSASAKGAGGPYGSATCPCAKCQQGIHGGKMTTNNSAAASTVLSEPKDIGVLASWWAKAINRFTAEERADFLRDSTAMAGDAIAKTNSLLTSGDDHGRIGIVEDQWSGSPADRVETVPAHGPHSKVPSGKVGVAPPQEASGGGAARMETQYSEFAPQGGVQLSTEMLGRELSAMRTAMKSLTSAVEAQGRTIEVLKASAPSTQAADVDAAVAKAFAGLRIGKSIRRAAKAAVAKAVQSQASGAAANPIAKAEEAREESEKDGKEKKHDSADVAEEMREEREDDKEGDAKAKSMRAADLRLAARRDVRKARECVDAARSLTDPAHAPAVKSYRRAAKNWLAKAGAHLAEAVALQDGRTGPSSKSVARKIAKATELRKALAPAQSQNQDKWPANGEAPVGKGSDVAAADLNKAIECINKAASGMGMLTTTVQGFFGALQQGVSGGSGGVNGAAQASESGGSRLPPVFALAKGSVDKIEAADIELKRLSDTNVISFDAYDSAREAINKARMGLPAEIVEAMVNRLPPEARDVITRMAA